MDTKRTIRKMMFIAMWLVIGSGMLTLLIAAMDKQKKELCKGYEIKIKTEKPGEFFLDEEGVGMLLKASVKGDIKGKVKAGFNLLQMEQSLEKSVWIKDVQLYFDNHAVLHVTVKEREPVARLFTEGGKSFYMDADNHFMPLSEKTFAKVPVFTGFPDKKNIKDSALLNGVNSLARYISTHPFWTSQVAQVDITNECGAGCWEFEMIPLVGRHVVKLGDGKDLDQKFQRLFAFYEQVLNHAGFDHYKTIDVRFAGQVIGGKSDSPKTDSVKLAKSVHQMLLEANRVFKEDITSVAEASAKEIPDKPLTIEPAAPVITKDPDPSETRQQVPKPLAAKASAKVAKEDQRIPKAVMSTKQHSNN